MHFTHKIGVAVALALVIGTPIGLLAQAEDLATMTNPSSLTADASLFAPIAAVSRHPRCLNCHTTTDWPRQGDDRHRHAMNVLRGPDDHGVAGMECSSCHGDANAGYLPGAPHWGLAPLSMAWEYMTEREMCEQLKDPARNGGKSVAELHEHMVADPLVLWAWEPGVHPDGTLRTTPPIDLAGWNAAMENWIAAGAPCPQEDDE